MHIRTEKLSVKYVERSGFSHLSGAKYKGDSLLCLCKIQFTGDLNSLLNSLFSKVDNSSKLSSNWTAWLKLPNLTTVSPDSFSPIKKLSSLMFLWRILFSCRNLTESTIWRVKRFFSSSEYSPYILCNSRWRIREHLHLSSSYTTNSLPLASLKNLHP